MVEHVIGQHHVKGAGGKRQVLDVEIDRLDASLTGTLRHPERQVSGKVAPARNVAANGVGIQAGACANIQHALIATPCNGVDHPFAEVKPGAAIQFMRAIAHNQVFVGRVGFSD